ncbi:MAG: hypothetical protein ACM30G_11670 [Micromonosporaceae bacterium]
MSNVDAVIFGGPCDGAIIATGGAGLVELEIEGQTYRYLPTAKHRSTPQGTCTVYVYEALANRTEVVGSPERADEPQTHAAEPDLDDPTPPRRNPWRM